MSEAKHTHHHTPPYTHRNGTTRSWGDAQAYPRVRSVRVKLTRFARSLPAFAQAGHHRRTGCVLAPAPADAVSPEWRCAPSTASALDVLALRCRRAGCCVHRAGIASVCCDALLGAARARFTCVARLIMRLRHACAPRARRLHRVLGRLNSAHEASPPRRAVARLTPRTRPSPARRGRGLRVSVAARRVHDPSQAHRVARARAARPRAPSRAHT